MAGAAAGLWMVIPATGSTPVANAFCCMSTPDVCARQAMSPCPWAPADSDPCGWALRMLDSTTQYTECKAGIGPQTWQDYIHQSPSQPNPCNTDPTCGRPPGGWPQ